MVIPPLNPLQHLSNLRPHSFHRANNCKLLKSRSEKFEGESQWQSQICASYVMMKGRNTLLEDLRAAFSQQAGVDQFQLTLLSQKDIIRLFHVKPIGWRAMPWRVRICVAASAMPQSITKVGKCKPWEAVNMAICQCGVYWRKVGEIIWSAPKGVDGIKVWGAS